ncbi:hypothetical protein GCM10029964_018400 [Kibdelosporangium lantanae]
MEDYEQGCARLRSVWEYAIAADGGPLPGAVLEPLITPQGWCGRVHGPHSSKVMAVVGRIEEAYELPEGSVVVRTMSDTNDVFLWAYQSRSAADYHLRWPQWLDGSEFVDIKRESAGTTLLDLVKLTAWARAYKESWQDMRSRRPVDVEQFTRRLNRLRAGILDILERTRPRQVRDLLISVGIDRESLPVDIATAIDYPTDREPTLPIQPFSAETVPIQR